MVSQNNAPDMGVLLVINKLSKQRPALDGNDAVIQ